MVDRITPATSNEDREWLLASTGIIDRWPVVSEPFRQWILEDNFAGGRPAWGSVGALFTDRLHDWELYKLRLLNAGHSSVCYLSALAGIEFVHEALETPVIRKFLTNLLYREVLPTLPEIPGFPREKYIVSVVERFSNRGVCDQIKRICLDGSAKMTKFLVDTMVAEIERDGPVNAIAAATAGWARYLSAVDIKQQASDASGEAARRYAARAAEASDPAVFLEYDEVFPRAVRDSERFCAAFSAAYKRIVEQGPMAAMEATLGPE